MSFYLFKICIKNIHSNQATKILIKHINNLVTSIWLYKWNIINLISITQRNIDIFRDLESYHKCFILNTPVFVTQGNQHNYASLQNFKILKTIHNIFDSASRVEQWVFFPTKLLSKLFSTNYPSFVSNVLKQLNKNMTISTQTLTCSISAIWELFTFYQNTRTEYNSSKPKKIHAIQITSVSSQHTNISILPKIDII